MSDYTKTTNFAAKDSLPSGNSGKIVKGSEIDTEFTNIQTAVATKLDINNSALTGTTTAQTLDISGNVDVDGTLETDALSLNGVTVTSTAAELNYVDGVTSNIQTQLDAKAPTANPTFTGSFTSPGIDDNATSTAMTLDSSGNVGIGVTSMAHPLVIQNATPVIQLIDSNATTRVAKIGGENGNVTINIDPNQAEGTSFFSVDIDNTERMRIDSSGSVGIGTSSPASLLTIQDATPVFEIDSTTTSNTATIQFTSSGTVDSKITHVGNTGLMTIDSGRNSSWGGKIAFVTDTEERMRIDSSGNVGIGTSSATALLEVEAASNPEISIASSGGATSNFLNFKAISHSQQIQTQLKTVDNGDFTSDLAFLFKASGTGGALSEKARIEASGNLSINNNIKTPNDSFVFSYSGGTDGQVRSGIYLEGTNNNLRFYTSQNERARIDNAGNLLVGTTSNTNTGKVRIQGATSSGGDSTVLTLHQSNLSTGGATLIKIGTEAGNFAKAAIGFKRTDDYDRGAIIFCQENTGDQSNVDSSDEVMRIDSSGNLLVGTTSVPSQSTGVSSGVYFVVKGDIIPSVDAGLTGHSDLGDPSTRYEDAYVRDGVTTGSDGRDKQDIEELSDAEQRVAVACKGLLRKWRWKSSVAEKGDDARIHFGIIAQDLQSAFEAEGLDAGRYAMFINSTWTDEDTGEERSRMGVRYSELLAFIIAAI
jgi:hypothetical protein